MPTRALLLALVCQSELLLVFNRKMVERSALSDLSSYVNVYGNEAAGGRVRENGGRGRETGEHSFVE